MKGSIALICVSLFVAVGLGADGPLAWPQFRGPGGSGVADGQKPPVEFGPDKNVKWKVPAPAGLPSVLWKASSFFTGAAARHASLPSARL